MMALMIKFKRRSKLDTKASYSVDEEEIYFFDWDSTRTQNDENEFVEYRSYIVFTMELVLGLDTA